MLGKYGRMAAAFIVFSFMIVIPVISGLVGGAGIVTCQDQQLNKDYPPYSNYPLFRTPAKNIVSLKGIPPESYNFIPNYNNTPFCAMNIIMLDHPWPMQGYNKEHLGRSPYSTSNNPGIEKWRFRAQFWCDSSPVVGSDGAIYFGSGDGFLYAILPNGTLKWKYQTNQAIGDFGSSPAIAGDGTIYVGTFGSCIDAINPNGTLKWKYWAPEGATSITIGDDGIIYYGHNQGVTAQYPNGTLKWVFHTGDFVQSTPAVYDNGIIYFGSHDYHVYAVYPNGTMKWSFPTGNWVHGSPTISPDGTIYVGSDDDYLYALYPNGTMKWRVMVGGMRASPSLDKEGNLYFGVWESKIISVAPNGTIRWIFNLSQGDEIWGSTAAISDDSTIYVGVSLNAESLGGGEIIALNSNGTLYWKKVISDQLVRSSAVIGTDGTVYICSSSSGSCNVWGHLHAFGPETSNTPPNAPIITGPEKGHPRDYITININATDNDLNPITYYIDEGDGEPYGWTGEWGSGEAIYGVHQYHHIGSYTIKAKAKDSFGAESEWGTLTIKISLSNNVMYLPLLQLFERFFERHPHAFPILRHLLGQ